MGTGRPGRPPTKALYAAREHEIDTLATLTAQRPSLRLLLQQADIKTLTAYLETLQQGADLDWIAVCYPNDHAHCTGHRENGRRAAVESMSLVSGPARYDEFPSGESLHLWMIAAKVVETEGKQVLGQVVVGHELAATFAEQMQSQTGLEHTLLVNNVPVVTSLPGGAALTRDVGPAHNQASQGIIFDLFGKPYYARRMILQAASGNTPSIQAEVALDVADMVSTGQRLIGTAGKYRVGLGRGICVCCVFDTSHQPAAGGVADVATAMSCGDLSKPFISDTQIREVALVG